MNKRFFILLLLALSAYGQQNMTSVSALPSDLDAPNSNQPEALADDDALDMQAKEAFEALRRQQMNDSLEQVKQDYFASISSDPEGASLSFNGVPDTNCTKTPCNAKLGEGSVRIMANLEQYETADTTVFINQNGQRIAIKLKPNLKVSDVKHSKASSWIALGLNLAGAALIYIGMSKNDEMKHAYKEDYRGHKSDFDTAWKKVESKRSERNTFYVIGSLVLATGIGVHIWF